MSKPLSEQEWREKIIDLVYDAIEYGEELHTGHVKTDKEIKKDFGKLLSTVDSIVDLILSDRQAWGEHVIDDVVAHTLENVYPLDVFPRTTKEDKDKINQIDGYLHSRAHIDGIYHGLHILRREARGLSAREDLEPLPQETLEYYEKKRNQGEKTDE